MKNPEQPKVEQAIQEKEVPKESDKELERTALEGTLERLRQEGQKVLDQLNSIGRERGGMAMSLRTYEDMLGDNRLFLSQDMREDFERKKSGFLAELDALDTDRAIFKNELDAITEEGKAVFKQLKQFRAIESGN